jgi:hypothetical protein
MATISLPLTSCSASLLNAVCNQQWSKLPLEALFNVSQPEVGNSFGFVVVMLQVGASNLNFDFFVWDCISVDKSGC